MYGKEWEEVLERRRNGCPTRMVWKPVVEPCEGQFGMWGLKQKFVLEAEPFDLPQTLEEAQDLEMHFQHHNERIV